jgi:hypothetical protein
MAIAFRGTASANIPSNTTGSTSTNITALTAGDVGAGLVNIRGGI